MFEKVRLENYNVKQFEKRKISEKNFAKNPKEISHKTFY